LEMQKEIAELREIIKLLKSKIKWKKQS
jgi:hypothetical protein